ncbi:hypothetical protein OBCHQ24_04575 [Oceanobacillus iheyensis]|nr:hypothetical protein OBCHQ24_04575 [Oceanobacillus iheyensis]
MRKSHFKARLLVILLLGLLVAMFTACSSEGSSSDGSDSDNRENTSTESTDSESTGELSGEIEFMTNSLLPAFDEYLNNLKEKFETEHPNVTVTINDVPHDQIEQYVITQAAGGTLPDVMNLNTKYVKKIGANGALVNMDEAAADVKDTFFEGIWQTAEVDGNVYALPWYTGVGGLMYNPELLEEAGFSEPPKTFEEAWDMSEVIHEKTGAYGQVITGDLHFIFTKEGIPILNEDNTAVAFNTPEAVQMWTDLKEYYDKGLYDLDVVLGQAQMPELYAQEKVAWWGAGPALFRQVRDLSPEIYEKSRGAKAIEGKAGVTQVNPMNIAVSATSKSPEAALEFAKFVTNAENQLEFAKEANVLPPVIEAANDEYFADQKNSEDPQKLGVYYGTQALESAVNMIPPIEDVTDVYEAINQAFQQVILEDMDPAEALTKAEEEVNALIQ